MQSVAILVDLNLRISFTFPAGEDIWEGIEKPKRLKLDGWVADSFNESQSILKETLFFDIYSEKEVDNAGLTTPTLGIGCPSYLEKNQMFPRLKDEQFHVKITEIVTKSGNQKWHHNGYYIDTKNGITRVTSFDQDVLKESMIDHNLGIKYELESDGKCKTSPIVKVDDLFTVDQIMWMEGQYKYVGKTKYEHRSELVDVWESMELNKFVGENFYDKVVTTQLLAKQTDISGNSLYKSDYLPIAAEKRFYKIILDKYVLIESRKRDFFDFTTKTFGEAEYHDKFQLNGCYDDPYEKMYITLQISSIDLNFSESIDYAAVNINQLLETIKRTIADNLNISYLRITSIDFEFEKVYILAHIEIVEAPYLIDSLARSEIKFDVNSFNDYDKVSIKGQQECLEAAASQNDVTHVISCGDLKNLCIVVRSEQTMPKESQSGTYCSVFYNPFSTLKKLVSEVSLRNLVSHYLDIIGIRFSLDCLNCTKPTQHLYSIVNAYQDSPSIDTEAERLLFSDVMDGAKLKDGQLVVGVGNLGDCYRSCSNSDKSPCETFSFCEVGDQNECLISNELYDASKNLTVDHSACNVYTKNRLLDYHKISSFKFIKPNKNPLTTRSVEECARACSDLDDCHAFQVCDHRYCSFGNHFNRQNLVPIKDCDIYIPKKIQNYVKNAHLMIPDVIHSEVDLTLEQCAAICSDWKSVNSEDRVDCKSFNYCPKSEAESICQITSYSISSDGQRISAKTSDYCSNYEFHNELDKQSLTLEKQTDKSDVSSIGIISVFVLLGLLIGVITPFILKIFKRNRSEQEESITFENEFFDTTRI
ncbi:uncharacterized protein LOC107371611 isoform X2 [Tetranychus urticae]|nr:uncharacterized protein LOC107371611 isoform X2 [Tetranychus urticae]